MFERSISIAEVKIVITEGRILASYPEDKPYRSTLKIGWSSERPIHVVYAENMIEKEYIVITAYIPDSQLWTDNFTRRIQQ